MKTKAQVQITVNIHPAVLKKMAGVWTSVNNIVSQFLQDNLPDEASPGDWLGLRSRADLNSPIYYSSLCSISKWFLKMFSDDEQTMLLSCLFHVLMIFSLKKCWHGSVPIRFLFSFNGCPVVIFMFSLFEKCAKVNCG